MNKHGDQTRWRTQEGPGEAGARLKTKEKKNKMEVWKTKGR